MSKVARRETPADEPVYGMEQAENDLAIYTSLKQRIKQQTELADAYKKQLTAYLKDEGEADDKGHLWVTLPSGAELKYERRSGQGFDEPFAIEWLEEHEMFDCLGEVTVVDDDALAAAVFEKRIPKDVQEKMFPKTESFAFVPKVK